MEQRKFFLKKFATFDGRVDATATRWKSPNLFWSKLRRAITGPRGRMSYFGAELIETMRSRRNS
jgi:hypothetical protein